MRLVSITNFKTYAELSVASTDAQIGLYLDNISSRIAQFLKRNLKKQSYTELSYAELQQVWAIEFPIDSGVAVQLLEDDVVIDTTEYVVEYEKGRITMKNRHFQYQEYPSIKLIYTGGYAETGSGNTLELSCPDALKRACNLQAQYEYQHRKELGLTSFSMAGGSISQAPLELMDEVKAILRKERPTWYV